MTNEKFLFIYNTAIERINKIVNSKHTEYALSDDEFYNFNRGAEFLKIDPAKVLASYMTKHVVSVYDLIDNHVAGADLKIDKIEEKITDLIIYLLLLEAMLKEVHGIDSVDIELRELKDSFNELSDHLVVKNTEDLYADFVLKRKLYLDQILEKWKNYSCDVNITELMVFAMENQCQYLKLANQRGGVFMKFIDSSNELIAMAGRLLENPDTEKEIYPITSMNDAYVKYEFGKVDKKLFNMKLIEYTANDYTTMRKEFYEYINKSESSIIALLTPIVIEGEKFQSVIGELAESPENLLMKEFERGGVIKIKQQGEI